jgi:predicted transcriptional regulator of viral defense system
MAIDFKAKKPVAGGLKLRFVRFSGQALTQGVENIRIDGVPVRIYSAAKTIADCLKYRKKLGGNLAVRCCEKVSIDVNVANKDFGISQEYAVYENCSRCILFGRESISF